jgi:hypothetical protein
MRYAIINTENNQWIHENSDLDDLLDELFEVYGQERPNFPFVLVHILDSSEVNI